MAAEVMGKEAALFTTSGTQSNLTAMLSHCQRGDEVIIGAGAHILHHEVGGAFALGGLGLRTVPNDEQGGLDLGAVRDAIRGRDVHYPPTGLICLENTQNHCGGSVIGEEHLAAVRALADEHGLPVHLDGARIFNAAIALGVPAARLAAYADSLSFSLCKGLACPVGSVLCGSADFIRTARRYRKMLGGGMRQAGVIAAAGVYALDNMIERLAEDHDNARVLADGLAAIPGITLSPPPQSNLVFFVAEGWDLGALVSRLGERGVACLDEGGRIRMVTHYGVDRADCEAAVAAVRDLVAAGA
jgi:threonine aldolase